MSKKRHFYFYCFLLLLIAPAKAGAQFAALDRRPYLEKVHWVDSFYFALVTTDDSVKIFTASRQLKDYALRHKDEDLELEAELFEAYYYRKRIPQQDVHILNRLQAIAAKGKKEHRVYITARAINAIAMIYWFRFENYEMGFAYFEELERLLKTTTADQFPFMANCYYDIGRAFYIFKDYDKALFYLKQCSSVPETPFNGRIHCAADNMIGLSYQQLNLLDSSDRYFHKALDSKYLTQDNIYYTIITGNIGRNLYLRKDYDQAIPLLQQDVASALKEGRKGLAVGSATTLATIYLEQGKLEKAKTLTDSIFLFIRLSKQWDRLKYVYPIVSRYYAARGDLERSNQYLDSALNYNDSMSRKFSALQLKRAQQKTEHVRTSTQRQAFRSAQIRSERQRFLFFVLLMLLSTAAILIYYRQSRKNKEKQQSQELALQTYREELEKAEEQLQAFVSRFTEQNRLLEEMERSGEEANDALAELKQSIILTEEDWQKFRHSFNKVHVGFIDRLKQKHPQISPAEVRMVVLARLYFSTREMATALGISPNSIHVTWHRLRKKLDLSADVSLEELAAQI